MNKRIERTLWVGALTLTGWFLAGAAWAGDAPKDAKADGKDVEDKRVIVITDDAGGPERHQRVHLRRLGGDFGKGYLGVELVNLTSELRQYFGAPEDAGVMVGRVADGSPAADAGVKVGDIITSIDGDNVEGSFDLAAKIRRKDKGDKVTLEIFRDHRPTSLRATVAERDREVVDLAPMMEWRRQGGPGEERELRYRLRPGDLEQMRELHGLEALGDIDWGEFARNVERSRPILEQRLAEMEKRLADLQKKLDEMEKNRH
ncbi:MAG TPA: PDZ domain-containing protein [Thermoanaerobaculia bacterium]|nr:PDZ domain-containing protein [Thermoanaerobaculia bacterium]